MPRESYYQEQRQYSKYQHDRSLDPEYDARNYRLAQAAAQHSQGPSHSSSYSRNSERYDMREYESRRVSGRQGQYPSEREVASVREMREAKAYKEKEGYYDRESSQRDFYDSREGYSRAEYADEQEYYSQKRKSKKSKHSHKRKRSKDRERDKLAKKLLKQQASLVADYDSDNSADYTGSSKGTPTRHAHGHGLGPSRVTPESDRKRTKSPSTALSDYSKTKYDYDPVSQDNSPGSNMDNVPRRSKDSRQLYHSPTSRYYKDDVQASGDIKDSRKLHNEEFEYNYEKATKKDKLKYSEPKKKKVPTATLR